MISQRKRLFWRFAGMLIFLVLPLLAFGLTAGLLLGSRELILNSRNPLRYLIFLIPLLLPVLAAVLGALGMRRVVNPLADVIAAADALAEGRFEVRVPEQGDKDLRRLTKRFNRMAEELERAENQRQNLTADVAHELRTPLQILQGNLEGALDGVYEPDAVFIQNLLEETRLLERLVGDLQTLSLAESGELDLDFSEFKVQDLLSDIRTSFLNPAEERGIDLRVKLSSEILFIQGDWQRLDQVLSNLVSNAMRFTPEGGEIILEAAAREDSVYLEVSDSGKGMSPDDLPYVFERFWKADKSRGRGSGGSGLGLAIARQLVEAHGGEITVESEVGVGTTFQIRLPVEQGKVGAHKK